jgi:hypothetical protein
MMGNYLENKIVPRAIIINGVGFELMVRCFRVL